LAIGFVFGAYYTETFRGAFQTVDQGQLEAAMAYGMRPGQVFRRVMLPQMLSFAIPGINNNWLGLMKASALVSILGLEDMVWLAEQAGRATQKPFLFYFLISLIYMTITALSGWMFSRLARRYALYSSTARDAY
jgi:ABC-type arginine transport system permease subunit